MKESVSKQFFTFLRNIKWKIVAIFIGVLSWVIAVNVDDPLMSVAFMEGVQIENSDFLARNELVILNDLVLRERMGGVYRVRTSDRMYIERVVPVIDMSEIDVELVKNATGSIELELPIGVKADTTLSDGRYNVKLHESTLKVTVDTLQRVRFPLVVEIRNDVEEGFSATPQRLANPSLFLTGPRSLMSSVDKIVLYLDLETVEYDINLNVNPVVLNSNGDDITRQFTLSHPQIQVGVSIDRTVKIPVHAPPVAGSVAYGYALDSVRFYPQVIEVIGNANDLTAVSHITLPGINIDDLTRRMVISVSVDELLPDNVVRASGMSDVITVTVEVSPLPEEDFNIDVSQLTVIGLDDTIQLESQVSIRLRGTTEALNSFQSDRLKGSVDVSGLEVGEHLISVKFEIPNDLVLVTAAAIKVEVKPPIELEDLVSEIEDLGVAVPSEEIEEIETEISEPEE